MKNINGEKIEDCKNSFPATKTFLLFFNKKDKSFSIEQASSKKDDFWEGIDNGNYFLADERGSEKGKIRALMNGAFKLLQNQGFVSGNTYEIKEIIRELGFRWNRDQKRWEK